MPFGYHVRELACHHMMAYHDRLAAAAEGDPRAEEALRSHCRRAVLELVLRRKGWDRRARTSGLAGFARGLSPLATALLCLPATVPRLRQGALTRSRTALTR